MKATSFFASAALILTMIGLTSCSASTTPITPEPSDGKDVITPLSVEANDLQEQTVNLTVGQALNINTGDLPVDSYTGLVTDTTVAVFVEGNAQTGSETNPGVEAVSTGTTTVTMTNKQGGIQPLTFTVVVTNAN